MKFERKQFTAFFVLISLFTLTSGLCYGTLASANMTEIIPVTAHVSNADGCGESISEPIKIEKKIPLSDSILPCCEDRHNNVSIALAAEINEKINLDVDTTTAEEIIIPDIQQKTYLSSVSPPQKPDILSSILKKE